MSNFGENQLLIEKSSRQVYKEFVIKNLHQYNASTSFRLVALFNE